MAGVRVEFWKDMMSLPGDSLGISPNLCGKDHGDMGKFLKCHYEGYFLCIGSILCIGSMLEELMLAFPDRWISIVCIACLKHRKTGKNDGQ